MVAARVSGDSSEETTPTARLASLTCTAWRARIARMDLHRGMDAARRRAADEERDVEALALHLGRDMDHLVERGRDEAGKADRVRLPFARDREDLRGRRHHAEIDDLVIVAGEHDADDVLADVVHVALDGRHHDRAGGLARVSAAAFSASM